MTLKDIGKHWIWSHPFKKSFIARKNKVKIQNFHENCYFFFTNYYCLKKATTYLPSPKKVPLPKKIQSKIVELSTNQKPLHLCSPFSLSLSQIENHWIISFENPTEKRNMKSKKRNLVQIFPSTLNNSWHQQNQMKLFTSFNNEKEIL